MLEWLFVGFAVVIIAVVVFRRSRPKDTTDRPSIVGVMHANINCRDFERSRVFYEQLGFRLVMSVKEDGPADIAKAVGMPPYKVRGGIMSLPDGTMIDLLQWREPNSDAPPYPNLYQTGIARLALETLDIDADIKRLQAQGVEFLSEPVTVPGPLGTQSRFACFKDPDGTYLELIETGPTLRGFRHLVSQAGNAAIQRARKKQAH